MSELAVRPPDLTDEHRMFRKTARDFIEKELAPFADEYERNKGFPDEIFKKVADMGFLGLNVPEEYGGMGLDYWFTVIWLEELVRSRCAGLNLALAVQSDMATPVIGAIGTDDQKTEFWGPAIRGERIAALGISEPGAGSDVASIRTTATRDGDDYVINGAKTWITNGSRADFITLAVRTGDEGFGGISLLLFPTDTKGFSIGRLLEKVGNHSSDTAELAFDNCRVPARNLLGQENMGFYYIMQNFQGERLVGAIMATAGMELLMQDAIQYGTERQAFGRPLTKFQVWRHKFVEHLTNIEAGRRLTYHACDLFARDEAAVEQISMAKLYTCDLAQRVVYDCQQFHGGYGYVEEYYVARAFRDLRLLTIGGGTSEIMKEIIGKCRGL
ncbi:MAG: acyl-CoA dehydrogenase [Rickettsiales bacterium]|nr:acyl-CoA dehydrogenase [Rickettsiales bacterium]